MREGDAELEHPEQEDQEHGHEQRELHQALAALPGAAPTAHSTGSMRIAFDCSTVAPSPSSEMRLASGVTQVCS